RREPTAGGKRFGAAGAADAGTLPGEKPGPEAAARARREAFSRIRVLRYRAHPAGEEPGSGPAGECGAGWKRRKSKLEKRQSGGEIRRAASADGEPGCADDSRALPRGSARAGSGAGFAGGRRGGPHGKAGSAKEKLTRPLTRRTRPALLMAREFLRDAIPRG